MVLGVLCVVDDSMRNESSWIALSQSFGFMFSQHTLGSSCLTSDALEGFLSLPTQVGLMSSDERQHVEAPFSI